MPYDDPEPNDPQELVGVDLPGDEAVTRDMAAAFADEFAQLGMTGAQILALFRTDAYAGAYRAWRLLGEAEIARLVNESVGFWGRISYVVTDTASDDAPSEPLRFFRRRS